MARPNDQEPTLVPTSRVDDQCFEHPAFAQIAAHRVSGGGQVLYDSDFEHQHYMTVTLKASQLNRHLSRDWHFPSGAYFEVAMSEAQWCTFVSSPNSGAGVPCTLTRQGGKLVPGIPLRKQTEVLKTEVRDRARQAGVLVQETMEAIAGELGAGVSDKKKKVILAKLAQLRRELDGGLPFIIDSAEEHMENVVEKAKVEVNAYMTATVQRAGLAAIAAQQGMPLQLRAGEGGE